MSDNHGTYFVGRAELVSWINNLLALNYTKIEQTHNGAAACQVLDALHPGSLAFSKVNFDASTEYEMIHNYKILQAAFNKLNVQKARCLDDIKSCQQSHDWQTLCAIAVLEPVRLNAAVVLAGTLEYKGGVSMQTIDVQKLVKGKPLDNIEFMQWLKSYFDRITANEGLPGYDGANRRAHSKGAGVARRPATGLSARPVATTRPQSSRAATAPAHATGNGRTREGGALDFVPMHSSSPHGPEHATSHNGALDVLNDRVQSLTEELNVSTLKRTEAESERDFYFAKLRDIELLCQAERVKDRWPIMQAVENILYAASEEAGTQERTNTLRNMAEI